MAEQDPHGRQANEPGAKLDHGKNRVGLMVGDFPRALARVAEVATYGAAKYTDHGWRSVPAGESRYRDAMYRHLLADHRGEPMDVESELAHLAHAAWNILAVLELRERALSAE